MTEISKTVSFNNDSIVKKDNCRRKKGGKNSTFKYEIIEIEDDEFGFTEFFTTQSDIVKFLNNKVSVAFISSNLRKYNKRCVVDARWFIKKLDVPFKPDESEYLL